MVSTAQKLQEITTRALDNEPLTVDELLDVADAPLLDLVDSAREVTQQKASPIFNFCAIVNAKSGRCSENCHWCAQSRHYRGQCEVYELLPATKIIEHAKVSKQAGATRFSLVTSGRKLSPREVRETAEIIRLLKKEVDMEICLSAGLLTQSEFKLLKEAGASRCHCNLETAPSFFADVCTSHSVNDKLKTIKAARQAGLEICSGGIIGMGETRRQRIELALLLRSLDVPSIPINILAPIPGTPLESAPLISEEEIVRTVAIFRFANPTAYLRFAGGRRRLSEKATLLALEAGINSAIAGDMLTTKGTMFEHDKRLVSEVGYKL